MKQYQIHEAGAQGKHIRMLYLLRGICHMQAVAYANGKVVTEAELMAQIVKAK